MVSEGQVAIWWVRRDFRLADNPALRSAIDDGEAVLPLFVLDPALLAPPARLGEMADRCPVTYWIATCETAEGHGLSVMRGKPAAVVPRLAKATTLKRVHISADFGPYGRSRDGPRSRGARRRRHRTVRTGSPYAVAPGTLKNGSGRPFQVFSAFHRAWMAHGVHEPAPEIRASTCSGCRPTTRSAWTIRTRTCFRSPEKGQRGRHGGTWLSRDSKGLADYDKLHDFPGADATSHLSIALRWGHLHPRTVLHDLARIRSKSAAALARQIAWRDFFADVLFHRPEAVSEPIRHEFSKMPTDDPDRVETAAQRLKAWQEGRTGYPLVDAGMRQLLAEGWMHNRVRMVVASFLIKDLHIGWWHGADWFMEHLRDGDIAQNQLNWQWVAGCGTDAAPYFRIFNPTGQSEKFDPDGSYIRRYVPELADVPIEHLHTALDRASRRSKGLSGADRRHAVERKEALDRYAVVRGSDLRSHRATAAAVPLRLPRRPEPGRDIVRLSTMSGLAASVARTDSVNTWLRWVAMLILVMPASTARTSSSIGHAGGAVQHQGHRYGSPKLR